MQHFARIEAGVFVEPIDLPDGVELTDHIYEGLTVVPRPDGVSVGMLYANGKFSAAPGASVSDLAAVLISAGTTACAFVDQQVVPDETHRTAYTNAATIVFANGGKAPSVDPAKSIFAAQAGSLGLSADAFAAVVQEVALVSLQLATILSTLRSATGTAKSAADLAAALTVFETAIGALVTALNAAGLTITVAAPPAIVIVGING